MIFTLIGSSDNTTMIVALAGAVGVLASAFIAGVFTVLSKSREVRNEANKKFIDEKIKLYEKIRVFIKEFYKNAYIENFDFKTCDIAKQNLNIKGVPVFYIKLLSDKQALQKKFEEFEEIMDCKFFMEPELREKMSIFKWITFYTIEIHKKGVTNPKLLSFLIARDIRHFCTLIEKEVLYFYTKRRLLRFGKAFTVDQTIAKRDAYTSAQRACIESALFYFIEFPSDEWNLEGIEKNIAKINPDKVDMLKNKMRIYNSVCAGCCLECDCNEAYKKK